MTMFVYICIFLSLSIALGGATDNFEDAVTPCLELYDLGKCSTAQFDEAIKCMNDLNPKDFEPALRRGILNLRKLFRDQKKECNDLINGPNPNLNVVTEPCFDLYDKGQCESADFDGAIQCIDDIIDSGKFSKKEDRLDLLEIKQAWQVIEKRCVAEDRFIQPLN